MYLSSRSAAGSLDANLDEVGYRGHCFRWGYRFFQGSLESIDREAKTISLAPVMDEDGSELIAGHTIRYDILALALGSVSNDFGVKGVKEHCLYLDSREQADRFLPASLAHGEIAQRHQAERFDPRVGCDA